MQSKSTYGFGIELLARQYVLWQQTLFGGEIQAMRNQQVKNKLTVIHSPLKTERREKAMKREIVNQALLYGIVSTIVLITVPLMNAIL